MRDRQDDKVVLPVTHIFLLGVLRTGLAVLDDERCCGDGWRVLVEDAFHEAVVARPALGVSVQRT